MTARIGQLLVAMVLEVLVVSTVALASSESEVSRVVSGLDSLDREQWAMQRDAAARELASFGAAAVPGLLREMKGQGRAAWCSQHAFFYMDDPDVLDALIEAWASARVGQDALGEHAACMAMGNWLGGTETPRRQFDADSAGGDALSLAEAVVCRSGEIPHGPDAPPLLITPSGALGGERQMVCDGTAVPISSWTEVQQAWAANEGRLYLILEAQVLDIPQCEHAPSECDIVLGGRPSAIASVSLMSGVVMDHTNRSGTVALWAKCGGSWLKLGDAYGVSVMG